MVTRARAEVGGRRFESPHTSRETTFDPLRNLALVLVFFAPGTRETFSPGW